jgi:hypothetical protein
MGREVKRVPLDFDWPQNEVWKGYLQPDYRSCPNPDCDGGTTKAGVWLGSFIHLLLIAADDAKRNRLHPWVMSMQEGMCGITPNSVPPVGLREVVKGLIGRDRDRDSPLGYDAIDRWCATKSLVVAAGLPEDWIICQTCQGHGIHPDEIEAMESWKATEPPTGEGWQMWETCSEGSPISPVFKTPEELAHWLADTGASSFGSQTSSYESWLGMIVGDGWSPSMVIENGVCKSGVDFVAKDKA